MTGESVERFQIGYAPGYPDFLMKRLSRSFSPELLAEAGLVVQDAGRGMRDRFRGRVMFPVQDLAGNPVGFGGRILEGAHVPASAPKYMNSPDGPVYHKSTLLYNLNRAKAEITRSGRAFLVEGYTDVIALDQAGIGTAVATCGTALGEEHVRLLSRFTERAILAFDSDEAGARAAERAFSFHQRYPVDLSVLILPKGLDPADFVRTSGGEAFGEMAGGAIPLVEYMIDRSLVGRDLSGVEERARAVREGLALVAGLEDPVRRDEYARRLAGKVGESETAVLLELERQVARPPGGGERVDRERGRVEGARRSRSSPSEEVEAEVLKLLVQEPALCARWAGDVDADRFGKPTHRRAFDLIRETDPGGGGLVSAAALTERAQEKANGEQLARLVAALALEPLKTGDEPTEEYAHRLFLRLEEFWLKRRADEIRGKLERLNPVTAPDDHETLFTELVALEGERRRVRARAEAVGSVTQSGS
jgi:DNA primase